MSEKAQTHIRALRRLIETVSASQLDEIYFLVGQENLRRQALQEAAAAAKSQSP